MNNPEQDRRTRTAKVLATLKSDLLADHGFVLGGGSRLVLEFKDYRSASGIDFLCASRDGFESLQRLLEREGCQVLFRHGAHYFVGIPGAVLPESDGLSLPVTVDDRTLKICFKQEHRVPLYPGIMPHWARVRCLTFRDCFTEKLLANAQRWADPQSMSRDLVDLAILRLRIGPVPADALAKIGDGDRPGVLEALERSVLAFMSNRRHRRVCYNRLNIASTEDVIRGVYYLGRDMALHDDPLMD